MSATPDSTSLSALRLCRCNWRKDCRLCIFVYGRYSMYVNTLFGRIKPFFNFQVATKAITVIRFSRCENIFVHGKSTKIIYTNIIIQHKFFEQIRSAQNYFMRKCSAWKLDEKRWFMVLLAMDNRTLWKGCNSGLNNTSTYSHTANLDTSQQRPKKTHTHIHTDTMFLLLRLCCLWKHCIMGRTITWYKKTKP